MPKKGVLMIQLRFNRYILTSVCPICNLQGLIRGLKAERTPRGWKPLPLLFKQSSCYSGNLQPKQWERHLAAINQHFNPGLRRIQPSWDNTAIGH